MARELVKELFVKLYNNHNNKVKYMRITSSLDLEAQVHELLMEYKNNYNYAEVIHRFRLHSEDMFNN